MGDADLIYKKKFDSALDETERHLTRIETAFAEIEKHFKFPILPMEILNSIFSHKDVLRRIVRSLRRQDGSRA